MFPFSRGPVVIGMVHLLPLPGSPRFRGSMAEVAERAVKDASVLAAEGYEAILLENYGDLPFYPDRVPAETVAAMSAILTAVRDRCEGPRKWGVNVLRNDARAAVAVAAAAEASFIRVNVHVGATLTDQGIVEGRAYETLRDRARLAPELALLADVRVKHGAPLAPLPLAQEVADLRERGLADGILVTGGRTGAAPTLDEVRAVAAAAESTPVLVASGVTAENAAAFLAQARGLLVGTSIKKGGRTENPIDPERARRLIQAVRSATRSRSSKLGGSAKTPRP